MYFHRNINFCLNYFIFPTVTTAYKKENKSKTCKDNYRGTLSNISNIYERCIYDQQQKYFETILSKHQSCFRKGYNAQHRLIFALLEKWKASGVCGVCST